MAIINFKNVSSGFEVLPVGKYSVAVKEIKFNEEKNYFNWTFEIIACLEDEYEGKYGGRKLWAITSLKEKALWKLKDFLLALGATEEDLDSDAFEFDPDNFVGAEAIAMVTQRDYLGKMQNDVDLIQESAVEGLSLFK